MTLLLLNTTIKISVIVLAAFAATASLRRRSAAVRHFVLAVALACAAATPLVRFVAPSWQTASRMRLIDRPMAVFDEGVPATLSTAAPIASRRAFDAASIVRAAGAIWATGAGLTLLVLLVGFARLWWIASHSRRLVAGPWIDAAEHISHAYRLRRTPAVLHSDHPTALGTWGLVRPKIVVPADANTWPADRIRIVLAHELAHVRRRDWLVQTAAELLCAAYWFNPLVRFASRRLRLESEQACDDAVLTLGVEGAEYASELIDIARACRPERLLLVPTATIARPSSLERRVRAMLNVKLNRDPITRPASIGAAIVLAAVTVLVAGFGVSAQGQFATVTGTVLDQNSRPISGARLVLSNAAAQTKNEVKTDASGRYEFVGVPAGAYELNFESPGMSYLKREGLSITPGQTVEVNAVMRIGSIMETITVAPGGPDSRPTVIGYSGARPVDNKPDPCAQSTVGACIRPPVKIRDVRPMYPSGAAGGVVILDATIDANGLVTNTQVLRTPDPALSAAAMEAVNRWEFRPTHLDGQPIDTHMTVTVNFVAAK